MSLRIIALPLTTRGAPALTCYHFQLAAPRSESTRLSRISSWVSTKAANSWAALGKASPSSWKFKVYQYGEKLADRIEFEELALKGIDPVPVAQVANSNIPLIYPKSVYSQTECLATLRELALHRVPKHKSGFYRYLLIAPLTAPFAIIPIIPNLPFFYCVWRAWHHYRAYRASQHLQSLLDRNLIAPTPSHELDVIYKDYPDSATSSSSQNSEKTVDSSLLPPRPLLLDPEAIPAVISLFSLPREAGMDILRAMEQARLRMATP